MKRKLLPLLCVLLLLQSCGGQKPNDNTDDSTSETTKTAIVTTDDATSLEETSADITTKTDDVTTEKKDETTTKHEKVTTENGDETMNNPEEPYLKIFDIPHYEDDLFTYTTDVSKYLEYINPTDYYRYLIIANRQNSLSKDYVPSDMSDVSGKNAVLACGMALIAMRNELKAEGVKIQSVNNIYRSYSTQNTLYTRYTAKEKAKHPKWTDAQIEAEVQTYSAPPGTSEHQLGLAIDFSPLETADFPKTEMFKWMQKNAYKFGFILRYGDGQTDITGYMYEPWHWRFVGRDAATYIHENGDITLEEFLMRMGVDFNLPDALLTGENTTSEIIEETSEQVAETTEEIISESTIPATTTSTEGTEN